MSSPRERAVFQLVWLTGSSCDGCTIKALGDSTAGGLEALLTGVVPDLPRVELLHPALSFESGDAFIERLDRIAAGELGDFGVVNESALPADAYSSLGYAGGAPVSLRRRLDELARAAAFIVAWGDCAVWGGPHSLRPDPTQALGTAMYLGVEYRSRLGVPVINLPGCAPPHVLVATLVRLLHWYSGTGPPLELDETSRPAELYAGIWQGALGTWQD